MRNLRRRTAGRSSASLAPLLVIGGQKCGSTTLASDLAQCDHLHVELQQKELSPLLWRLPERIWRWNYTRVLSRAEPGSRPVDVSSLYSMRQRDAVDLGRLRLIGGSPKVVYVVRERMARAASHHHHDVILGLAESNFDKAATLDSDYVLNGCYAWQLQHWLNFIDIEQLLVVKFEDYIRDRIGTVEMVCEFAGVPTSGSERIDIEKALNVSATRSSLPGEICRSRSIATRSSDGSIPQVSRTSINSQMRTAPALAD